MEHNYNYGVQYMEPLYLCSKHTFGEPVGHSTDVAFVKGAPVFHLEPGCLTFLLQFM